MICTYHEETYGQEDTNYCIILSDTTPATFPTSGVGVGGLDDKIKIEPGSVLVVLGPPSEKYIMGEDKKTWHKWEG